MMLTENNIKLKGLEVLDKSYKGPCIYIIWREGSDKLYIGQTKGFWKRAKQHRCALKTGKHENPCLQNSYNNGHNFFIAPFELCTEEALNNQERFWINFFGTTCKDNGFNLTTGGDGGYKKSEDVINKMISTRKNNGKISPLKNKPQTLEHRLARSLVTKGISRPMSEETLAAVRKERATRRGSTQRGRRLNVFNLINGSAFSFDSLRSAEKDLGFPLNTLSVTFDSRRKNNKKGRRSPKVVLYKHYLIEKL